MAFECEVCGQSFDSKRGLSVHEGKTEHKEYHKKEVLEELYLERRRSSSWIADKYGLDSSYVLELLERHGIERRGLSEAFSQARAFNEVPLFVDGRGYKFWQDRTKRKADKLYVHRLLAVSEYGIEAVKERDVHHKNSIQWDNRPNNIEVLTKEEHGKIHSTDKKTK